MVQVGIFKLRYYLPSFVDKDRLKRAKLTYPFGFILKPFQNKDLSVTIEMALYVAKADAERKQAEKALRESEKKYRHLFSTVSDAIIIYDINSHEIVDVNGTACEWYGYSHEEFCKLKVADVSAEYEKSSELIEKQAGGEELHVPIRYNKKKDGTIFPVEISSGPAIELGGRSLGFDIFRDLSEKKGSV